ncbi:MAG: type I glyceraldehyde-3-phosphate dehydrogenase [Rickettsiales bacterium]|nr:type I glyceraldehyde-3-phosphate dehydrogenase [Rickettsiales bacterium]OUV52996.1 MAG: type I glyceraldehyde-3-phosphate dehydrogenase [Rickettsiales bacterium TMED127]
MSLKIAINGFGRIGRLTLRALIERNEKHIDVVAVNDLGDFKSNLHLLKYDSVHGQFKEKIEVKENILKVNSQSINFYNEREPNKLPWKELNVDVVIESTGVFTNRKQASKHLEAGARKVLISAPSSDADQTVVFGVNHKNIKNTDLLISNGSCTTNCLAPLAFILHKELGIESGYMTTVHAITGDQNTIDTFHKDLRRARNSISSMIPTSTGAAKAVEVVMPELKGKLDGSAIRVPTTNVSLVDFCFKTKQSTDVEKINSLFKKAELSDFKNIVQTINSPLVSSDLNHNPHSSIVDTLETKVVDQNFCRVLSWYDNEWGFSNRLIDVSLFIFNLNASK